MDSVIRAPPPPPRAPAYIKNFIPTIFVHFHGGIFKIKLLTNKCHVWKNKELPFLYIIVFI